MPVVLDHPVDDENAPIIEGRPDFGRPYGYGITHAKKHPPYVFSIRGVSCLVHKIARVELHWYRVGRDGSCLVKLKKPVMIAITNCQCHYRLEPSCSRTCHVPSPDAMLCGFCHGEPRPFGKHGAATKAGIKRQEAHVKLGCMVNGY